MQQSSTVLPGHTRNAIGSLTKEARLAAHPDVPEDDQGLLRGLDAWVEGDEAGDPHPPHGRDGHPS